jgi:hypothetical protein
MQHLQLLKILSLKRTIIKCTNLVATTKTPNTLKNLSTLRQPRGSTKKTSLIYPSFLDDINENMQVFVVGSSYSSNYTLGILEQIQDKKLEVFYVRPDVDLLTGVPKLLENMMFGVLQQYARSGLFNL